MQCRVEFKILGDIEVHVDGQPIAVGGPRTRAVLAMLVVNAGAIVAADVLQDELWPDQPAGRAAANLQVRMSELRGALRVWGQDQRLVTRPPGYLLRANRVSEYLSWRPAPPGGASSSPTAEKVITPSDLRINANRRSGVGRAQSALPSKPRRTGRSGALAAFVPVVSLRDASAHAT